MRPGLLLTIVCAFILAFGPLLFNLVAEDFNLVFSYSIIGAWAVMIFVFKYIS
jgi:hypothetical protein